MDYFFQQLLTIVTVQDVKNAKYLESFIGVTKAFLFPKQVLLYLCYVFLYKKYYRILNLNFLTEVTQISAQIV